MLVAAVNSQGQVAPVECSEQTTGEAGSGRSILVNKFLHGLASGRSSGWNSNDRSATWTGRLAGVTGVNRADDRSRRGRTGAHDPLRKFNRGVRMTAE